MALLCVFTFLSVLRFVLLERPRKAGRGGIGEGAGIDGPLLDFVVS